MKIQTMRCPRRHEYPKEDPTLWLAVMLQEARRKDQLEWKPGATLDLKLLSFSVMNHFFVVALVVKQGLSSSSPLSPLSE